MARISTYAIDGTPVSSDKLIGTDSSGTTTKNYPLGSVSDWLKESGASAVLGQNNYSFQIALDPDAGRLPGSFSFENYGGDGTEFTDVSRLMVSNLSSTGKYVGDYLLSTVGDRVMLGQLDDLNSFGVYTLVSLVQNPIEPTFYDAELLFVEGNGALLGNKLYGLATYSASASAESAVWGSIEGTVTNQTDLVDYIDAEIAAIPVPATPTLQSVTDEGNTTTNNIGIGTTSPSRNLEVSSSGTTTLRIGSTNSFGRGIELYTTGSSTFLDVEGNFSIRKSDSNPLWTADGTVTIANQYFYGGYINFRKRNTTTNLAQIGLEDGSNTYFNTGNVGIGTTAPSALLEIKSNSTNDFLKLTTGGGGATPVKLIFEKTVNEQGIIEYNRNGNLEIYNTDGDGGVLISGSGSANADMYVNHAGNVGIGTTAPTEILSVGDVNTYNTTAAIESNGFGTTTLRLTRQNNSYTLNNNGNFYIAGPSGTALFIDTASNVGIGTTAPSEKLEVAGKAIIRKSGTATPHGDTDFFVSDSTAALSTAQMQILSGNNASSILYFSDTDAYNVGGVKYSHSDNSMHLRVNGSDRMHITSNGRVGIGTTAPSEILQVGNDSVGGNYIQIAKKDNSNSGIKISETGSGRIGFFRVNQSEDLEIGTENSNDVDIFTNGVSRVTIDGDNGATQGYVGIGTTAPAEKLHVDGNIRTSSGTGLGVGIDTIYSNSVNINNSGQYRIGNAEFISKSANDMNIYQGRMWVTNTGNVGIGNTAPLAKLHVKDGNTLTAALPNTSALIEGFSQSILQVASHSTGYSQLAFGDQDDGFDGGLIYSNASRYLAIEAANVERMRFTANGNVGIGTTAPTRKLEVNGDIGMQLGDNLRWGSQLGIRKDSNGELNFFAGTNSTNGGFNFRGWTGSAYESGTLVIRNNGNVGIGTTAPAEKLDVIGNIKSTKLLLNTTNTGYTFYSNGESRINNITFQSVGNDDYLQKSSNNGRFWIRNGRSGQSILLGANDSNGQLNDYLSIDGNNQELRVRIASSDRFIINSAGNVGVGTTSPTEKIEVTGNVKATRIISNIIREGNNNGHLVTTVVNASNTSTIVGNNATTNTLTLGVKSSGAVTTQGKLGIGTTAPDSKLHVSAASGIAFKVNPNNVDKEWYIDTTNPDHLKKEGNLILNADPTGVHTSTKISFNIDGSNKASINSDGDLGVGTTAQTSKVHVDGTAMRQLRMGTAGGPSSNTDTSGAVGDMAYDDNYFYIKTASGWGRVQLDFGF